MDLINVCKKIFVSKPNIPNVHWVLYENGTVIYYSKDNINNKEDMIKLSLDLIDEKVVPGTSTADFSVNRMDIYFPNEPIYVVVYTQPENMITIIVDESNKTNDLLIGLSGRQKRIEDEKIRKVIATSFEIN